VVSKMAGVNPMRIALVEPAEAIRDFRKLENM
jgi:hypothetical protein